MVWCPPQNRLALRAIMSNTGWTLPRDEEIARSTAAVAACCARASLYAACALASFPVFGSARAALTPAHAVPFSSCVLRVGAAMGVSGSVPGLAPIFEDETGHGLGEALELERADGIELEYAVERGHGLAVGEDLAGLRLGTEARGEVGDVADGGVVPAAFEADRAERGVALRDADARAELAAAALVAVLADRQGGFLHGERGLHGVLGRLLERQGVVEEHHHRVAGEALDRALVLERDLAERAVEGAQELHHL